MTKGGIYVSRKPDKRFKAGTRLDYIGQTSQTFEDRLVNNPHHRVDPERDEVKTVGVTSHKRDRLEAWAIKKFEPYSNRREEKVRMADRVVSVLADRKERKRIKKAAKWARGEDD